MFVWPVDPFTAAVFAVIMFGFHWGVQLLMGIPFIYHLYGAALSAFIPWELLWRRRKPANG